MNELEYQSSIQTFEIRTRFDVYDDSMKINKKFMLLKADSENEIEIYNLSTLLFFKSLELNNINFYNFHNYFENIFFVCSGRDIMLYEINLKKNEVNNLSKIKGHFSDVLYVCFNPSKHNILVSICTNFDIKIFDLQKSLSISHIFLDQTLKYESIKWGEKNIGVRTKQKILTFNYEYFLKSFINEFPFDDDIQDFHFYSDEILIVLERKKVLLVEKSKEIQKHIIYNAESFIDNNFYSKINNNLILFIDNNIKILSIIYSIIYSKANVIYIISEKFNKPIFIEEPQLNDNELCVAYNSNSKSNEKINKFSIIINTINTNKKEKDISKDEQLNEFLKKIYKNTSDISFILSVKNNIKNNYILNKKYFEYEEIKKELDEIKKRDIFERKEIVKNDIAKIKDYQDIKGKFIFILKLLVNDNTNKELIMTYLKFFYENKEKLKNIFNGNIEDYDDELNYYLS